ncbi:MAG: 3-aminobutyryl-CoA ammonia lyase [Chloroflexi bacterium GWC2_73_18]|nr:MAG: 3-aminobutyryl-CoA ammonia lyase [Chloroflexi bacterium GWC2_73_18]
MSAPVESFIRFRVGEEDVHYGGGLVAGATMMKVFGDIATELTVIHDGDEGLLRAYELVEFLAPVAAGDFIEARGRIVRVGNTSRTFEAEARKVIAGRPDVSGSAADVLPEPVLVARARGTTVVPKEHQRRG